MERSVWNRKAPTGPQRSAEQDLRAESSSLSALAVFCFFPRYVLLLITMFFVPGVMMIVAYGLISRELYRGIQFELGQNKDSAGEIRQKHSRTCARSEIFQS